MPKVTYVDFSGVETTVEGQLGESVMRTALKNGIRGIVGECGGSLSCATCHVFVDAGDFDRMDPIGELEEEMLDGTAVERAERSRLSCQIIISDELGDLHVAIPEYQD